jgi:Bifunctional DNA primase/polymerase, N-terminal
MGDSALANALGFARRGYPVLPLYWPLREGGGRFICSCRRTRAECTSPAKHPYSPLAPRGLLSATTESGIIKHWLGYAARDANYAVRTDGALLVLDIDPRNDGDRRLADLESAHAPLPHTWRSITGGNGEHIFFNADGLTLKRGRAKDVGLGDGIDVPGYIVGPGSRHICGRLYAWSVDHHPAETALAPPPLWLVERLTRASDNAGMGHDPAEWAARTAGLISEYRDLAIAQVAGKLLRAISLDPAFVATLVHDWNACHCNPPLPERAVQDIFNRIADREARRLEADHAP